MILLDPKTTYRFQPDPGSPTAYILKVPTVSDRPRYRHAVRSAGGKQWTELQMLAALADGVRAIMTEPEDQAQRENLLNEIAAYRERLAAFFGEIRAGAIDAENDPVEFLKRVAEEMVPPPMVRAIERVVIDHYQAYAGMVADREVYQEISCVVAARMFLRGWEGIEGAKFRFIRGEVPEDVLSCIPSEHLAKIGAEIERLMEPAQERLRPLRSPSGSAPDPIASNGTGTPPQTTPSETTAGSASSSESQN